MRYIPFKDILNVVTATNLLSGETTDSMAKTNINLKYFDSDQKLHQILIL